LNSKNSKIADLNDKRHTSFLIGYILALALIFVTLEWTQKTVSYKQINKGGVSLDEGDVIPYSFQNLPPPPPQPTIVRDILNLVETDVNTEEEEIKETEVTEETAPDIREYDKGATYGDGEYVNEEIPWAEMQIPPRFPGGDAALLEWVRKNIIYSIAARERGDKGRIIISFVIDKTGQVINGRIEKGVSPELDAEALRIISIMPNWEPGIQNNQKVKVRFMMPITFKLTKK